MSPNIGMSRTSRSMGPELIRQRPSLTRHPRKAFLVFAFAERVLRTQPPLFICCHHLHAVLLSPSLDQPRCVPCPRTTLERRACLSKLRKVCSAAMRIRAILP